MRLSIVGKGYGCGQAPTEGEVWGIGDYFMHRYCTAAWEMHDFTWTVAQCLRHKIEMYANMPASIRKDRTAEQIYGMALWQFHNFKIKAEAINDFKIPLVTVAEYNEDNPVQGVVVPTSVAYPLFRVVTEVLSNEYYVVGTLNYALAYAIYIGKYSVIDIYGCHLLSGEEWAYQRPNAEMMIGIARGRGIKVNVIGSDDGLLRPPRGILYGYIDTYPDYVAEIGHSTIEEEVLDMLEQKNRGLSHETGGNYNGI